MVLLLSLPSCFGSSQPGGILEGLTDEQRAELDNIVGRLERNVGFDVLLPAYLPNGLERLPQTDYVVSQDEATAYLFFWSQQNLRDASEGPFLLAVIIIEQPDPAHRLCPPCPGFETGDREQLVIRDHPLAAQEVSIGEGRISHDLRFHVEDVYVTVDLDWQAGGSAGPPLSDDQKREGVRVAESMLLQD